MGHRWSVTLSAVTALVLALVAPSAAWADRGGRSADHATGWYLAMGDSLAAGYQPTTGDDPDGGYVGGVLGAVRDPGSRTRLVNVACSGETVVSMVEGGRCDYEKGTQLAQALHFLHAHARFTRLITIDIGANDVQRCVTREPLGIDGACLEDGMTQVATRLPAVLGALRDAAPGAEIVVLNYYNPFLAAYLLGDSGKTLAQASMPLQAQLNGIIASAAAGAGAEVADVATAFRSTETAPGPGGVPVNVATICAWTWMCSRFDIHANDDGYAVMASTVVATL